MVTNSHRLLPMSSSLTQISPYALHFHTDTVHALFSHRLLLMSPSHRLLQMAPCPSQTSPHAPLSHIDCSSCPMSFTDFPPFPFLSYTLPHMPPSFTQTAPPGPFLSHTALHAPSILHTISNGPPSLINCSPCPSLTHRRLPILPPLIDC